VSLPLTGRWALGFALAVSACNEKLPEDPLPPAASGIAAAAPGALGARAASLVPAALPEASSSVIPEPEEDDPLEPGPGPGADVDAGVAL
jgi:hypothetical protein